MNRISRKRLYFSDELERQYQIKYKCMPFDTLDILMSHGVAHDEAFSLVQEQMDDIWKEYRARKQAESEQQKFHSVPDTENPFHFTDAENDFLNHLYRTQEEQPTFIPPEYDIRGEQLELSFT